MVLEIYGIYVKDKMTDRQTTLFFYKIETYLDCLLVPEIYKILNFVKIVRAVVEIYVSYVHRQTGNPIFYNVETYLDHLLMLEIHIIPNFVKVISVVLEIYEICV